MALLEIDSVNIPAEIVVEPDYTIPYYSFNIRGVSKQDGDTPKYHDFGFTPVGNSNIGGVLINYPPYLESFRLGIRQKIYENYSNIQTIKLRILFSRFTSGIGFTPHIIDNSYISNFGIYLPTSEIRFTPAIDLYENFNPVNLIDSYAINNDNTISFTLNSSIYSLYENNSGGFVDVFLKEISESSKPELGGSSMGNGIFYMGNYFKTEIYL